MSKCLYPPTCPISGLRWRYAIAKLIVIFKKTNNREIIFVIFFENWLIEEDEESDCLKYLSHR